LEMAKERGSAFGGHGADIGAAEDEGLEDEAADVEVFEFGVRRDIDVERLAAVGVIEGFEEGPLADFVEAADEGQAVLGALAEEGAEGFGNGKG
jgi:hypothetical protein